MKDIKSLEDWEYDCYHGIWYPKPSKQRDLEDNWKEFSAMQNNAEPMEIGDTVYLVDTIKSRGWLGKYAGTDGKILSRHGVHGCTVEGYDGHVFSCPDEYVMSLNEYYSAYTTSARKRPMPNTPDNSCKHENTYINRISPSLSFKFCKDCKADLGDVN